MCEVSSEAEDFEALHSLAQTLKNLAHKLPAGADPASVIPPIPSPATEVSAADVCKFMAGTVYESLELGVVIPEILGGISIAVPASLLAAVVRAGQRKDSTPVVGAPKKKSARHGVVFKVVERKRGKSCRKLN
jgi:hypothetical protein